MRPASVAYLCWGLALAIWLAVKIADAAGIRINHTPSLPVGIWRIEPLRGPLQRGQIVSFCPPDTAVMREARGRGYVSRGRCAGGYEPMLKPVVAVGEDRVTIAEHGVAVNGKLAANSRRLALESHGGKPGELPRGPTALSLGRPGCSPPITREASIAGISARCRWRTLWGWREKPAATVKRGSSAKDTVPRAMETLSGHCIIDFFEAAMRASLAPGM